MGFTYEGSVNRNFTFCIIQVKFMWILCEGSTHRNSCFAECRGNSCEGLTHRNFMWSLSKKVISSSQVKFMWKYFAWVRIRKFKFCGFGVCVLSLGELLSVYVCSHNKEFVKVENLDYQEKWITYSSCHVSFKISFKR